ncbi:TnsD family Tn7-like transposition protein [Brevibacillus laterosporus]|uniref:TnsD family Tn7-like transposition protein n=1 Tax=Brevibacillus laterosporus TaxID=1465 RepID=UPI00264FCCB9|nr:TnsD family Tn7-like transposition protein [Brevibacillus laterosporus]MDN9011444.1 TnsD family Tn7-like transposition protein [Brevibacillus laterosporus]MDO0942378.1 TnsD family Tn7-like transposition protein [Brevibacillus laterosporus]
MIGYLPVPYQDELLYSIISRYQVHVGNTSTRQTNIQLLGKKSSHRLSIPFPANLNSIFGNVPEETVLSPDKIISEHTLLPVYQPFIDTERYAKATNKMKIGNASSIVLGVGSAKFAHKQELYFCLDCYEEETNSFGEAYWHRIHQVFGVLICPYHSKVLYQVKINRDLYLILQEAVVNDAQEVTLALNDRDMKELKEIANDFLWLLENKVTSMGPDFFSRQYIYRLQKLGLASFYGLVKTEQVSKAFKEWYGEVLLERLGCNLDEHSRNWLCKYLSNSECKSVPLYHVLIMRFLAGSTENFFKEELPSTKPFGEGPWVCLNPASEHYLQCAVTARN